MTDLMVIATDALATFLGEHLPKLSGNWWVKHVVAHLSFQQQRILTERRHTQLEQLDLAALLRLLDQNWYELSPLLNFPREGRNWVKELQNVRNRWAHLSAQAVPPADQYRDADTLGRLLAMLDSEPDGRAAVEAFKSVQLARLGGAQTPPVNPPPPPAGSLPNSIRDADDASSPVFAVGQIVALRSEPGIGVPIVEVLHGSGEVRYRVFKGNKSVTFYESQLTPFSEPVTHAALDLSALQARLTALQLLSPSTATLLSLRSGRIQFVPYQYRPVLKMVRADRPRLLIADEVGVGKTIEAGLILRELKARIEVSSVLVLCPKALVAERKWTTELKRFDEHFIELDGDQLRHCLRETDLDGEWPPLYAKAIVPFSLFDSDLIFGRQKGRAKNKGLLST